MLALLKRLTLSDFGNIASIIALLLTIVIFFNLRNIKRFYSFTARVPELLEKMGKHAGQISSYQQDFSNSSREIELELGKAEIVLKALKNKVSRGTKSSVKRVLKAIEYYGRTEKDPDKLWTVYVEIQKLIEEFQELQSDSKWRQ